MLFAIEAGQAITHIPHAREYRQWKRKMSAGEIDAIFAALNARFDVSEIETSSWIPGADWSETVYQPIYEKACNRNSNAAALCFGLMVWEALMNHSAVWGFGRYEKDGIPIRGMTYFRLQVEP
jgi:hypothetical protein